MKCVEKGELSIRGGSAGVVTGRRKWGSTLGSVDLEWHDKGRLRK